MAEFLIDISHEDAGRIENKLPDLKHKYSALENVKYDKICLQQAIFDSTLEFLLLENLVRGAKSGGYVLTAKAFSHLNKDFKNGIIKDEDSTYIKAIKSIFSSDTAKKISVGLATKVIPSLLGIS